MSEILGLEDLISQTCDDLLAVEKGVEGEGRLYVEEVIFEINMVAVESASAKGGIDLKVVTLGGDIKEDNSKIHKVTVKAKALPREIRVMTPSPDRPD
jgi:hypothetical protein